MKLAAAVFFSPFVFGIVGALYNALFRGTTLVPGWFGVLSLVLATLAFATGGILFLRAYDKEMS